MSYQGVKGDSRVSNYRAPSQKDARRMKICFVDAFPSYTLPLPDAVSAQNMPAVRNRQGNTQPQIGAAFNFVQGVVKLQGEPVQRRVIVIRKDTMDVLTTGLSGPNGQFRIEWKGYSGKVAVMAFDEESSGYNAKIYDFVSSV